MQYRDGIAGDVLDYLISTIPGVNNFKPELDMFINLPQPLKIKLMETVGKVAYDKNTCFLTKSIMNCRNIFLNMTLKNWNQTSKNSGMMKLKA